MANQYKNKVIYNGNTLIDISDSTVTADKLLQGYTAYAADGSKIIGTHTDEVTYNVTQQLTGVSSSNNANKVISGGSLYLTIEPEQGLILQQVTVTMGGVDITDQVFVPDEEPDVIYTITENLTDITSSNNVSRVLENGSLFIQLSPDTNKAISQITVTMGGVDITQQVFEGDQV